MNWFEAVVLEGGRQIKLDTVSCAKCSYDNSKSKF